VPNRLAAQKSPYLLQHAANPVDWYPWGEEAFDRARHDGKPIFLSVGYATCHWCHVMERESFENPAVAAVLNAGFVPVKVDREERPDVDRVYMLFVQATTGSGGWPMSVWLTPDLEPFHGGTYFPPDGRNGQPGFLSQLNAITRAWQEDRASVVGAAARYTAHLRELAGPGQGAGTTVPGPAELSAAVNRYHAAFDGGRGGFGGAPKFPRPSELLFLLREHQRTGSVPARDMALRTLRAISDGGIRDHIGGGFHRYTVDAEWRVPHFEKMLYDQAQLVLAFLEAAAITGDADFADVARDTLDYVAREMTSADGGFFSAQDADSLPPGGAAGPGARKAEGAFYLWDFDEVSALLGGDADIAGARFGLEPAGNAPFDPHGEFRGKNLLYLAASPHSIARSKGDDAASVGQRLQRARRIMYEERARRPRPLLDDKILTAWNGLMLAAFARGSRVLGSRADFETASRAASFLRRQMWDRLARTLYRRFREGDVAIAACAEDYAFLIWGLLELAQAGEPGWFEWALELQRRQDELFWDEAEGGWFSTSGTDSSIIVRVKETYDGAEPSASAVSVCNLLVISRLTGEDSWLLRADRTLRWASAGLIREPRSAPMMLAALSARHSGGCSVGGAGGSERRSQAGPPAAL
jgi:hypothetical protein